MRAFFFCLFFRLFRPLEPEVPLPRENPESQ
uniref:Uncharacterized protein n=1 Tax=Siphoviridae sp. ctMM521 TaxID=2826259 RepID=A0A8S5ML17_9CAUD|nr:MAG TPA: hypothetical protein [Siphoviridae sp. ctMM521]DAI30860.1 MAG TPA: hypothetical protein [Caudoviricetes sp.]DAJ51303.1 MAG TPA: hypothetical protein [Caudoviricetes sp.]